MERKEFIKTCGYSVLGIPLIGISVSSCAGIYYATSSLHADGLVVAKSQFIGIKKEKEIQRPFVLLKTDYQQFPICLYKVGDDQYIAALLKCTHRGCELNVGGGIYSCPCHGSEFDTSGAVLEGPAEDHLTVFPTKTDHENIYIRLS